MGTDRVEVRWCKVSLLRLSPLEHNHGGSDAGLGNATPDQVGGDEKGSICVSDGLLE